MAKRRRRSPAQVAASKRNLVKARAARQKFSSTVAAPKTAGIGQVLAKRTSNFRGLAIKKRESLRKRKQLT